MLLQALSSPPRNYPVILIGPTSLIHYTTTPIAPRPDTHTCTLQKKKTKKNPSQSDSYLHTVTPVFGVKLHLTSLPVTRSQRRAEGEKCVCVWYLACNSFLITFPHRLLVLHLVTPPNPPPSPTSTSSAPLNCLPP